MTDIKIAVPESAIIQAFSGVMAISPEIYRQKLDTLAQQHNVPSDDAFKDHVSEVLRKQPPTDWD